MLISHTTCIDYQTHDMPGTKITKVPFRVVEMCRGGRSTFSPLEKLGILIFILIARED